MSAVELILFSGLNIFVTKQHPINATNKAISFCEVSFSLKTTADISITKNGAVYKSTAATENVEEFIVLK